MPEGITILAKELTKVRIGTTWGFGLNAIAGSLLIVLALFILYVMIKDNEFVVVGVLGIIVFFAAGILAWNAKPVYEEVYEYKVLIDESISFREFNDRFITVSREGEIFTIRERTSIEKVSDMN